MGHSAYTGCSEEQGRAPEPELQSLVSWQLILFSNACRRGQGGARTRFRTLRLRCAAGRPGTGTGRVPPRPGVREPPPRVPAKDRGRAGSQSAAETSRQAAAMSASATFGGVSVQPPPPRASEARAAEEQPGLPLPRARAAAALPWQPGRPALYACASARRRLRAHPGLGDSGWGQVL